MELTEKSGNSLARLRVQQSPTGGTQPVPGAATPPGQTPVPGQAHQRALQAHQAASERTRRAWELGEATLSEHLLAQRQLHQARLAEVRARVEALQAALLVRIDAHALWHGAHAAEPAQAPAE